MFYCGIDVAKRKHAVAILDEKGQVHKPVFEVENTQVGLAFLVDTLKQVGGDVMVGLEATGHYWLSLYDVLTQNGFPAAVIPSWGVGWCPVMAVVALSRMTTMIRAFCETAFTRAGIPEWKKVESPMVATMVGNRASSCAYA